MPRKPKLTPPPRKKLLLRMLAKRLLHRRLLARRKLLNIHLMQIRKLLKKLRRPGKRQLLLLRRLTKML